MRFSRTNLMIFRRVLIRRNQQMTVKDNTLSLTDHNMVFGTNRKTPMLSIAKSASGGLYCSPGHLQQNIEHRKLSIETLSHLLKNCRRVCGLAANRIYSMRYDLQKKIKSIGKRYGHYGHPSAIVHYLLPIIAIQGSWGQLQWTGNILNMAILEPPRYGQTMATMAASMASRLSANRMFFYTAFSKGQKQVGQVGQVGQCSIVSTISCLLSRYKAPVAGWS